MKIVFDKNDIYKTLGSLNNKTFMAASYVNSKEAWGLPTFRRLRFKKEADIWKDPQVNAALDAVKKYAQKKGWKIATPTQCKNDARGLFAAWCRPDAIAKGTIAKCYNPKMVTAKGVTLATSTATFKTALKDTRDKLNSASKMVTNTGFISTMMTPSVASIGIMTAGILGQSLSKPTGALLVTLTYQGYAALMISYVPFVKPNGKIVWKKFGFFLIGEYKESETPTSAEPVHSQSLEADNDDVDVDMNDLTMDPVTGEESLFAFSFESLDDDSDDTETTIEQGMVVEIPDTADVETTDLAVSGVDVTALDEAAAKVADIGDTNVAANVIPGEVVDTSVEALNVELLGWDLD